MIFLVLKLGFDLVHIREPDEFVLLIHLLDRGEKQQTELNGFRLQYLVCA
jgi:ERCC4-type nuclease